MCPSGRIPLPSLDLSVGRCSFPLPRRLAARNGFNYSPALSLRVPVPSGPPPLLLQLRLHHWPSAQTRSSRGTPCPSDRSPKTVCMGLQPRCPGCCPARLPPPRAGLRRGHSHAGHSQGQAEGLQLDAHCPHSFPGVTPPLLALRGSCCLLLILSLSFYGGAVTTNGRAHHRQWVRNVILQR